MASIPSTMRSLAVRKYGKPSTWELLELPVPRITQPNEVLVKVHAASILQGDTLLADGGFSRLATLPLPLKIGQEGSGVVAAVGTKVTNFKIGDEVYGLHFSHPVFPMKAPVGWCSEYTVTEERFLIIKPPHLSFVEAGAVIGSAITAYQVIKRALQLMHEPASSLERKTVYIPGALSATGSVGIQILKNVYGAKKIISTVSTPKIGLVEQYLPGMVDELIDYQKQDVVKEVGKGSIDFVYNTQWSLTSVFPLAKRDTGVIMTIAGVPTTGLLRKMLGPNILPFWAAWIVNLVNMYYQWLLRGTNVQMEFLSGNPGMREDLEAVGEIIARKQVRPVVTEVDINDLDAVRREAGKVNIGRGGLGKIIFKIA